MQPPQNGVEYPLLLGNSFKKFTGREKYHTMRYDWKPKSIDASQPASFRRVDGPEVEIEFKSTSITQREPFLFKGIYADAKELDCVVIFDGTCFRLERTTGAMRGLRNIPRPAQRTSSNAGAPKRAHSSQASAATKRFRVDDVEDERQRDEIDDLLNQGLDELQAEENADDADDE
eukprot:TRINITY_DN15230_c0_g1_i1.p1 TRINITY_DN15230_c0_g1~~TRINITY_DN15230_c0_g1_i1.p1  ORF type:complete len:175 (+),score=22.54 TRINITY_DN15230_c0_g1_i1:79-603(+)